MSKSIYVALAAFVIAPAASAFAAVTITVTPSSAPNGFGSPSFSGWVSNALYAQVHGLTTYGAAGPTQYNAAPSTMAISDNVVTGFNSWKGSANPSGDYGAAYGSEYGNRLHFGIFINGNGHQISISQLSMNAVSTDPGNTLAFSFNTGDYNYNSDYQGILAGTDGIVGTGDDIYINSGPNTQLVDAIVGRGSGNAWDIYDTDPGATRQDKIGGVSAKFGLPTTPFDFTMTYSLSTGETGSGTVTFNTPEPASLALLGMGGMLLMKRRKRA